MMQLIMLAIACLSVQFFAKYAGHNVKKLPYDLVGLGGLFFLLTAASGMDLGGIDIIHSVVGLVAAISPIMGWLCLLGATLMGVLDLLVHVMHSEKFLPH
jgi:hypothetical protein